MTPEELGWDTRAVGGLVGLILVLSGASKALHIESAYWEHTVIWQYLGGSRALLLTLAVGEVAVGLCLLTWLRARPIFALLLPAFISAALAMIHEARVGGNRACGCVAEVGGQGITSFIRPLVLAAASLYVLARLRAPHAVVPAVSQGHRTGEGPAPGSERVQTLRRDRSRPG